MASDVQIANLALAKLGGAEIATLAPPKSGNERLMASLLPQWIDSEIRRHNWHFARTEMALARLADTGTDFQPFVYELPFACLRPVRRDIEQWTLQGRKVLSEYETLSILMLVRPDDTSQFDALFVNVLVARLALEACEKITQSNTKKADCKMDYKEALQEAKRANAFERFPDDISANDASFSWLSVRENGTDGWV